MKTTYLIIAVLWTISLATAYIIGGKINGDEDSTVSSQNNEDQSRRPSYRQAGGSGNGSSGKRTSGRSSGASMGSGSERTLNITAIAKTDDPIARTNDLLKLINRLGPNDFQQVVAEFRELGITRERMSEYSMLLHAWAKADPIGALDYAEKNTGSGFARQTILTSWAANDPEGAIAWAQQNHEGEGANPWLVGVIRGVVTKDPTRATAILQELPYSRERGDALSTVVPHIAAQGYDKATEWLASLSDERLRSGGTAYLAGALARQDAARTAEWLDTLEDSEGKSRATREVADEWAEQDLNGAIAWTNSLTGEDRTGAAREIIGEYAREDAAAASDWVRTMAGQPGYDRIVQSYIWNTARSNPSLALAQVPEIEQERFRDRYYERILRSWRSQDQEAADAWINSNNLSENVLNRVMRENGNDRRNGR